MYPVLEPILWTDAMLVLLMLLPLLLLLPLPFDFTEPEPLVRLLLPVPESTPAGSMFPARHRHVVRLSDGAATSGWRFNNHQGRSTIRKIAKIRNDQSWQIARRD
jgi:hypothetical protein